MATDDHSLPLEDGITKMGLSIASSHCLVLGLDLAAQDLLLDLKTILAVTTGPERVAVVVAGILVSTFGMFQLCNSSWLHAPYVYASRSKVAHRSVSHGR